jgi:tetratricopeptide (TPR) repeat protein
MLKIENVVRDPRRFKILIAHGDAAIRRTIRNILQTLGFSRFREAEDGDDALRKLRSDPFDLVISARSMPLLDGLELRRLARKEPVCPAPFLLTGQVEEESDLCRALTKGKDDYLIEPLLPQEVEDRIIQLLFANLAPSELDVHLQAAGSDLAAGRLSEAHQALDKAEKKDPRSPLVYYFRKLVYDAEGRPDQAEEALDRARRKFAMVIRAPRQIDQLIERGGRFLAEGKIDEARRVFGEALAMEPNHPERTCQIGEAYLAHGLPAEAEKFFLACLESYPEDIHMFNRLGIAYRRQRKFSEAIANYEKALALDPHEENLLYNLARAHLSAGNREKAIAALDAAIGLAPDFREAKDLRDRLKHLGGAGPTTE